MIVYVVQHSNSEIEFANNTDATNYANTNSLSAPTSRNKITPDLKTTNANAGLTTEESNQMFDEYVDVMLELKANDLPGAITLLQGKSPSGFITQDLINDWIAVIEEHQ